MVAKSGKSCSLACGYSLKTSLLCLKSLLKLINELHAEFKLVFNKSGSKMNSVLQILTAMTATPKFM